MSNSLKLLHNQADKQFKFAVGQNILAGLSC